MAENFFEQLVQSSADGVLAFDMEYRYTVWNPALERLFNISRDEVLGRNAFELFPFLKEIGEDQYYSEALAGQTVIAEKRPYTIPQTGQSGFFEAHYSPIYDDSGEVSGGMAIIYDVTQQQQAMENLHAEIAQRNHELLALQFAAATITSSLDLQAVLNSVTKEMANLLGVSACAISEWDLTDNTISLIAEYGPENWLEEKEFQKAFSLADFPLTKRVLVERRAQQLTVGQNDIDSAELDYMQQAQIKTLLMLPMEHQDRVVGLVELMDNRTERTFTYAEIGLAQMLANQAAIAIENARLYEQAQRDIAERERIEAAEREQRELAEALYEVTTALNSTLNQDELLEHILINVGRVVPHDTADIMLVEDGVARIVNSRGYAEQRQSSVEEMTLSVDEFPTLSQMVETGQPLIISDTETDPLWTDIPETRWVRSYAGAPIRVRDEVVGFIDLTSATAGFYTPAHAKGLQAFAHQAGIAIGNARLFEQMEVNLIQTEALYQVTSASADIDSLEGLLQTIADRVAEALSATWVAVVTLNLEARQVNDIVVNGPGEQVTRTGSFDELMAGLTGWAVRERKPTLSLKGSPDPRESPEVQQHRAEQGFGAVIVAPLLYREKILGTVTAVNLLDEPDFTLQDAELMMAIANQAAIAIENTRLFEETRQRAEQLQSLRQVSEDLTAFRDLDTLLSQIVERAMALFNAGDGGIHLYRPERQVLEWTVASKNLSNAIGLTLNRGEGVSGKVWETGDPLIVEDYQNWSGKSSKWSEVTGVVVGVPIQWGDDFLGVLNLRIDRTRSQFTADDLPLLSQFATQAAIAIQNARLFEAAEQRVAELEAVRQASLSLTSSLELQPVLEAILDSALKLLTDTQDAHIFTYQSGRLAFGAALWPDGRRGQPYAEPRPHGLTYTVAKQGQPIVVADMRTHPLFADAPPDWEGGIVGLPLKIGQRVVGVMNVSFRQAGNRPEAELRMLELLADQAAIAIENARLHEETERSLTQIARLYEFSTEFASSLSLLDAADLVIKKVVQATNAHSAVLNLLDDEGNLELAIAPHNEEPPRPSGTTMTIFKTGQPLIINDVEQEPGVFSNSLLKKGIRASLGLPLKAEARTMGVLFVRYQEPRHFSDQEIETLFIFANQAAIAIQNARLYEQAQREIAERKQAEATLRKREHELQTIFNSITDYIWSAEIIDGQVKYRYYSPVVERITGYPPEYFMTGIEAWLDIVHPDDRVELKQDLEREFSGELVEHEYRIIRPSGDVRWLYGTTSPTLDESGNVIRLDGVVSDVTERKEAETALQESEERFRILFQSSPDGVILIDPHSRDPEWVIVDCNEAACRMNGYERAELIGQPIDILHSKPADPQERADYLARLRREGHIYVESYHRRKDGTVFPIEISTALITLSGQEIVLGIDRDITERKEAEQALAEERNLLRTLIDNLPDYIYFKDTECRFILGNVALAQIMGAETPEDLIGRTDFDFYPEDLAAQYYADDQSVLRSGRPLVNQEEPIIDPDGNEGWISTTKAPLFDRQGQVTGLVGMGRDITERKQVEAELKAYREHLETLVQERTAELEQAMADTTAARDRIDAILHSVADGLIVTDLEHRVILANPAAAELLELPLDEILDREIGECIRDDRLQEIVGTILDEQKDSYEDDIELTDPATERTRVLRARTALVHDRQEQPMGTVTIIQDVTRLREVDQLKTELLTTAAHELRTPLTSIMGFSEILLSRELDKARHQRYLTMISEQSNHLAEIIDDLLDVSRLESGRGIDLNCEWLDLAELMAEVVLPFAETATEHDIRVEGLAELPAIEGDPFRLAQVGRNLLSNAIKYSPQGGVIIIRGQTMPDQVKISIQDEGIGMTPEQQEHLFEPFYRADSSHTAVSGTGLGLAISRLIVEQHGGEIWLGSEQGKGTIVHFTLPLNQTHG